MDEEVTGVAAAIRSSDTSAVVRPHGWSTASAALLGFLFLWLLGGLLISAPGAAFTPASATPGGGWCGRLGTPGTRLAASAAACCRWFGRLGTPGTRLTASTASCRWFCRFSAAGTGFRASAATGRHGAGKGHAAGTEQSCDTQSGQCFFQLFLHTSAPR